MSQTLYCFGCDKQVEVPEGDFKLLMEQEAEQFEKTDNGYHYRGGCFYKNVVLLKRQPEAYERFRCDKNSL